MKKSSTTVSSSPSPSLRAGLFRTGATALASALALFSSAALAIAPGTQAPNFKIPNQDGKMVQLSDYRGKYVLLYFYPKDETPGCTAQACTLRDQYDAIKAENAVVFGISRQSAESHKKFIAHHKLPFDLLVDSDGAVGKSMGVGSMPIVGFSDRDSILIGPDGKVIRFYENVDPVKHAGEVLADLKKSRASEIKPTNK